MTQEYRDRFLKSLERWLGTTSTIRVAYISRKFHASVPTLCEVLISISPDEPNDAEHSAFEIETAAIAAGRQSLIGRSPKFVLSWIGMVLEGTVDLHNRILSLNRSSDPILFHSSVVRLEEFFFPLQLDVFGADLQQMSVVDRLEIEESLRIQDPAFDGLQDLCQVLSLSDAGNILDKSRVRINVAPTVDINLAESSFAGGVATIALKAYEGAEKHLIHLSVRGYPDPGIADRRSTRRELEWRTTGNTLSATTEFSLEHSESVMAMLSLSGKTIRRHLLNDPIRARNERYIVMQNFDTDLKMLRNALYIRPDGRHFEVAVCTLLFLLGFASGAVLAENAPDLLAASPSGTVLLVECTTKISDFATKMGKLVDRRGATQRQGLDRHSSTSVLALLVCSAPKAQIAARDSEAAHYGVVLLTGEDLERLVSTLRSPTNPDRLLEHWAARIVEN